MRILMVLLLLGFFLGDVASAQSVYKCVAKGKTTSFQSAPCAAGTTTARTMLAIPEPVATQPQPGTSIHSNSLCHPQIRFGLPESIPVARSVVPIANPQGEIARRHWTPSA